MNLNITQTAATWRYDFTYRGVRLRKSGFHTYDEAERHALEAMLGVGKGETTSPIPNKTLADLLTLANTHRWDAQKDGERTYTRAAEFVEFIGGGASLDKAATGPNLLRFREYLLFERDLGNASCNRYMAAVKGMFDVAREHGWLKDVPSVRKLKETPVERKVVSPGCRQAIQKDTSLHGAWGKSAAFWALFLLDHGLRLSEVRNMTLGHNKGPQAVLKDTKNGDERWIPLAQGWDNICNYPFSETKLREYLAGYELTPHDLRHTFITDLIESGTPLPVVMKLAGHRDIKTTQRYYHLTDRGAREAMKRKEEYLKSE